MNKIKTPRCLLVIIIALGLWAPMPILLADAHSTPGPCAQIIDHYIGAVDEFRDTAKGMLRQVKVFPQKIAGKKATEKVIADVVNDLKNSQQKVQSYPELVADNAKIQKAVALLPPEQQGLLTSFLDRLNGQQKAAYHRFVHWSAPNPTVPKNISCHNEYRCDLGDPGCTAQRIQ